jgi:hypothetical protein
MLEQHGDEINKREEGNKREEEEKKNKTGGEERGSESGRRFDD